MYALPTVVKQLLSSDTIRYVVPAAHRPRTVCTRKNEYQDLLLLPEHVHLGLPPLSARVCVDLAE